MYPYNLLKKEMEIFPIFGETNKKIFNLSMDNSGEWFGNLSDEEIKNQELFQDKINQVFEETNADIIISEYLENRERMFSVLGCEQMINQGRFYHLGLDLSVKCGTNIYIPFEGKVFDIGYEQGEGNYGGYIILEHEINGEIFYSLYGHLNPKKFRIERGQSVKKGDIMGEIGDFNDNGGYFYHTHLQIITEEGKQNGFFSKGYCTKEQLSDIQKYVPDPRFLFRY